MCSLTQLKHSRLTEHGFDFCFEIRVEYFYLAFASYFLVLTHTLITAIIHTINTHWWFYERRKLLNQLEKAGFTLLQHGSNHDIYIRGSVTEPIERLSDIPEGFARDILKRNKIK